MYARPLLVVLGCGIVSACDPPATAGPGAEEALSLAIVSGDSQVGDPGAELPEPLTARVLDARGRPVRDQLVNFQVTHGGGSVFAGAALSDHDGVVREWWTLGPNPGENRLEARAVDPATGEKLVFATFHAIAQAPPAPADPLAGTWTGVRQDGGFMTFVYTNLNRNEINPITGNVGAAYAGQVTSDGVTQTYTAWLEGALLYYGVTSRGELTAPDTMTLWSAYVEPFTVTRVSGP
jgi:hypothetical protein